PLASAAGDSRTFLRAVKKEQGQKGSASAPAHTRWSGRGVAGGREITARGLPLARQIAAGTRRPLLRSPEWIGPPGRWHESLFGGWGGNPPHKIEGRARLVVGPRSPAASERLLAHYRARRFVVDVEVSRREAQLAKRSLDGLAISREDGSGQRIRRGLIAQAQRLLVLRVRVHVRADHRRDDFLAQNPVPGVGELNQSGAHEPAGAAVGFAAREDRRVGALFSQFDVRGDVLERVLVDHRAHEVSEIRHVPDSDLRDHLLKSSLELRPNRLGNVDPTNRRGLLPLVFITPPTNPNSHLIPLPP